MIWALHAASLHDIAEAARELSSSNNNTNTTDTSASNMVAAITAVVAGWSTLALNIADFSRYAVGARALTIGQAAGFVPGNVLCPCLGILVVAAFKHVYGKTVWDLVTMLDRFSPPVAVAGGLIFVVALVSTNVIANLVSPANDIANLWPAGISFRAGGLASLMAGTAMQPWRIFTGSSAFLSFMIQYSIVTGALLGVLLCDYFLVSGRRLVLAELYNREASGCYWYSNGFNYRAVVAVLAGVAPCIPGLLRWPGFYWRELYLSSWFVALVISGFVYVALSQLAPAEPKRVILASRPEPNATYIGSQQKLKLNSDDPTS